ncbi:Transmembrane protein 70 [Halocaridina rubra]|uniref:Transmembrane protein 70 n=1 Tax=Halocaridina rubra TaxID=373956 RepID=A0AAN8X4Y4_HALRR
MSSNGVLRCILQCSRSNNSLFLRLQPLPTATARRPACVGLLQVHMEKKPLFWRCLYSSSRHQQKPQDAKLPDEVDIGPGTWKEIYYGILTTQVRMTKLFSLSTSMLGLMMQPVLMQKFVHANVGFAIAAGSFIGFFTFVTPLLIHWITKKYVTRLEYDPQADLYSATTLSFFLREKKIHFKVDDVKVPDVPGLFTTFHVKNKALFVEPQRFQNIEHYGRIMGYDKPIDFSMEEEDEKGK